MRQRAGILVVIVGWLLGAAVASAETVAPHTPQRVGVILPSSGIYARYGEQVRRGLERGVDRTAIEVVYEDEGCQPLPAVQAYQKLTAIDQVKYIVGPMCGSSQMAVAPLVKGGKQLVMLTGSAPEAVHALSGGAIFSSQLSIEAESTFLANEMNAAGIRSVAILFVESGFARAHEAAFRAHFAGQVVTTMAIPTPDPSAVKSAVAKLLSVKAGAIFLPDATPLMLGFAKELSALGGKATPVWAVNSVQSEDIRATLKGSGVSITYSYPDIGTENALEYFPALGMQMLSAAVTECGADRDCAQNFLRKRYPFDERGVLQGKLVLRRLRE